MAKALPTAEKTVSPGQDPMVDVQKTEQRFTSLGVPLAADGNLRAAPGFVHRIVIANADAAAHTVYLLDATANVAGPAAASGAIPILAEAGKTTHLEVNAEFFTGMRVQASSWAAMTVAGIGR